tara:strand:- start:344 stop:1444 length:1101 start_codon:yes stop_codon:yes gene_type:complete
MKRFLLITSIFFISCCSYEKEVSKDRLVERNGVAYEVNSEMPFIGVAVSYYENGQLQEKTAFKDGVRHGTYEQYYENGQLEYKINYVEGKEGPYESYYQNGQLNTRVTPGRDEVTYYENGQLQSSYVYNDKKNQISYQDYEIDGEISTRGTIEKETGNSIGTWEFYEAGELVSTGTYNEQGKKEGLWTGLEKVFFKNGIMDGAYERHERGKIVEEGTYKDGKKDGIWRTTKKEGLKIEEYKKGVIVLEKNIYTTSGNRNEIFYDGDEQTFDFFSKGVLSSRTKSTCSSKYASGECLRWELDWKDFFWSNNGKRYSRTIYGENGGDGRDTLITYCEDGIKIKRKTIIYGDDYFGDRLRSTYTCPEDK